MDLIQINLFFRKCLCFHFPICKIGKKKKTCPNANLNSVTVPQLLRFLKHSGNVLSECEV